VRDNLQCTEVPELDTGGEMVWIKLQTKNERPLYLCACYRPDVSDTDGLQRFDTSLRRAAAINNAQILVAGDFNFPSWDWQQMSVKPRPSFPSLHQQFIDLLHDTGMDQLVLQPTRLDNTLDLVLSNSPSLIPRVEVIPGISDHCIVFFEYTTKPDQLRNSSRPIPLYRRADWDAMRQEMLDFQQSMPDPTTTSTEDLWQAFRSALQASIAKHVPSKTPRRKDSYPWLTYSIRKLIRKRDRKYRLMKKSGDLDLRAAVKNLNREINRELRRSYWRYTESLFTSPSSANGDDARPDQKRFWTFVKHQRSTTVGVPALKSEGRLVTDPKQKAELLNSQFYTAFSEGTAYSVDEFRTKCTMPDSHDDYPAMADITISVRGVQKMLANLNPTKAAGPDGISPRVLKELAEVIAPILTSIFSSSLQSGDVPRDWREALVTPVFKKGEHYRPSNYRPISITSVCVKVLEHILVSAIMQHFEVHGILSDQQHGFRKNRSCETQLLEFVEEVSAAMERGTATDAIVLDFAKAFDRVNHTLLVHKLDHYGIRGNTNRWIAHFLSDRRQAVVVNGAQSGYVSVKSGVPQGSVLGPCLFLAYINDLPSRVSSPSRLFADDTALYRFIACPSDPAILQDDLRRLEGWEKEWDMAFHPDKCSQLPLTRSRKPLNATTRYTLHGQTLERITSCKYLGVTLQSDLSWGQHVDTSCAKANRALGFLRRSLKVSSKKTKELAYKAMVRPIVEYASTVWDPHTNKLITNLEKVQRRAARYVTGRYHNTSSVTDMLQQLQWPSLEDRRRSARLAMLYKISNGLACVRCPDLQPMHASYTRSHHPRQFQRITCRTDYRKYSFFPRTISDWNSLPTDTVLAPTLSAFRSRVLRSPTH
jgi:hypothetical protein